MPIYLGEKLCKLFRGNYGPVSIYKGARKIAGYTEKTKTGSDITFNNSYNDYAKVKASGNTVTEFEPIATTPPTFSRSSTAYKSDGSVVNAGVPRIESGKGVLVEEGTTNLLPINRQCSNSGSGIIYFKNVVNFTYLPDSHISLSADSSFSLFGQNSILVACDGTIDKQGVVTDAPRQVVSPSMAYTISAYVVGSGNVAIGGNGANANYGQSDFASRGVALSDVPQKLSLTFTTSAAETGVGVFIGTTSAQAVTFKVVSLKLETKPYPTSFTPTTRSPESLTIPASCLNASEGTIEFDCYVPSNMPNNGRFFSILNSNNIEVFRAWKYGNFISTAILNDSGVLLKQFDSANQLAGEQKRIGIRYKVGGFALFLKGIKIGDYAIASLPTFFKFFLGCGEGGAWSNAYFSNLRISSIARSDAELANTGTLTVDEYTTYFAPFNGDLSATKRHWTAYDSSGTLTVSDNASQSQEFTLPTLRKIGSVADEYDLGTGVLTKRISDWITLDGSLGWSYNNSYNGRKGMFFKIYGVGATAGTPSVPQIFDVMGYKYNSIQLNNTALASDSIVTRSYETDIISFYFGVDNIGTGWNDSLIPTSNEIKAYFYGWQMCNADNTSPYYKSEVPYTPSTWAEWITTYAGVGNVVVDETGMTITLDVNLGQVKIPSPNVQTGKKYGQLVNVVSNPTTGKFYLNGDCYYQGSPSEQKVIDSIGNIKNVFTVGVYNENALEFSWFADVGKQVKIKDIRMFELPAGSQIESDFTNLTADELCAKYTFNGLCTKYWRKITDYSGLTSTLPTASYEGYTPYKMIYQLATPVITELGSNDIKSYYPTTKVLTAKANSAEQTIEVTAKEMDL